MRFKLIEAYLDPEEKFWDYGTKEIKRWIIPDKLPFASEIFDTSTLGGFEVYSDYLKDKSYTTYMTPREYFERCAKGFESTFSNQVSQVERDTETLKHLRDVIFKYHKSFPMAFISDSHGDKQEGRHRMYIAAELFGWDKSFPVLLLP